MTTTRWWWIRHAPVTSHAGLVYGNQDVPCDCGDEAVFRGLAARLPDDAAWVVTPLGRTRATAEAIARHHAAVPADFEVEARLAEQDFGDWQGLTHDELAAQRSGAWHRFWLAPAEEVPPGGESFAAVSARVGEAIAALTRRHAGRDIVCVSHGGPIRAALGHALGVTPEQALAFSVDNCALTRLDHFATETVPGRDRPEGELGGAWRIAQVNVRAQHAA
ncbi:histidine phosphatase family protein [Pelagibius sp. CAU 1746]|uniref:histidine phosphatase family protein n=1 Tax=Pelagibius sp. CAU 1746 TaxID=3140370 RepID=UPI00325B70E2